jgi:dephospho-CoA kinase
MIVIGIVGKQNAGKDALADYLSREHGFKKLSTGDMIRDLAEREGVACTRNKLQDVASELISRRGEDYLAGVVLRRIEQHDWDRVAITGLRTPTDVKTLRERLGDDFTLVHVSVSDPKARFSRAEERGEPRDADTYEEFLENDRAEEALFDLDQTLAMADITIGNDGTIKGFHNAIDDRILQGLLRNEV